MTKIYMNVHFFSYVMHAPTQPLACSGDRASRSIAA